jgi:hypothetical protein
MGPIESLRAVIAKRAKLVGELDASRVEIDEWLAAHCIDEGVTLKELAFLAGIVELRRAHLVNLAALDEEFLQNIRTFAREPDRH